ncbi:hypothetical protein ACU4GD_39650 [Cupriavidus basilensis]
MGAGVGGLVGLNAGPDAYIADSSSRGTVGTSYGGLNVGRAAWWATTTVASSSASSPPVT